MRLHSSSTALPFFLTTPPPSHPYWCELSISMHAFSFFLSLIVKDIYAFPLRLLIQLIPNPSNLFFNSDVGWEAR